METISYTNNCYMAMVFPMSNLSSISHTSFWISKCPQSLQIDVLKTKQCFPTLTLDHVPFFHHTAFGHTRSFAPTFISSTIFPFFKLIITCITHTYLWLVNCGDNDRCPGHIGGAHRMPCDQLCGSHMDREVFLSFFRLLANCTKSGTQKKSFNSCYEHFFEFRLPIGPYWLVMVHTPHSKQANKQTDTAKELRFFSVLLSLSSKKISIQKLYL